jgi:hypothetical protein
VAWAPLALALVSDQATVMDRVTVMDRATAMALVTVIHPNHKDSMFHCLSK